MLSFSIKTVRYADDFIVIANSENLIVKFIRPAIVSFLAERGLELSTEKTKTFCIASGKELCFLGYVFKYRDNWKLKYSFFKDRIGGPGIAMYPDKSKVNEIIKKLKEVFIKSTNQTAYELISIVNPIIRGWSNYFNMGESSTFRGYLRYALYLMVWDWAHRKHPKWGRINIAKTYFLDENLNVEHSGNGNLWTFRGITRTNSRYSNMEEGKVRFMLDPNSVVTTVSGRSQIIPKELLLIHGYHDDVYLVIENATKTHFASLGKSEGIKGKLLKSQKARCVACGKSLLVAPDGNTLAPMMMEIHHITPISKGGSKSSIKNMNLLHKWCHQSITKTSYTSPDDIA